MGFNFHVGLPGPFSYNHRIGGRKRKSNGGGGKGVLVILGALAVGLPVVYLGWWSLAIFIPVGLIVLLGVIGSGGNVKKAAEEGRARKARFTDEERAYMKAHTVKSSKSRAA